MAVNLEKVEKVEKPVKEWQPNGIQKLFLETVKANPNKTLAELSEIAGVEFKSGAINTLSQKGLVDNSQKVTVVKMTKTKVSAYRIIE